MSTASIQEQLVPGTAIVLAHHPVFCHRGAQGSPRELIPATSSIFTVGIVEQPETLLDYVDVLTIRGGQPELVRIAPCVSGIGALRRWNA